MLAALFYYTNIDKKENQYSSKCFSIHTFAIWVILFLRVPEAPVRLSQTYQYPFFFYRKAKLWETCHANTGIWGAKWQGYFILNGHYYNAQAENYSHITAAFQTHESDGPNNLQSTWLTEAHFDLEEISQS